MNWLHRALLSALFAARTAVLAKAGAKGIETPCASTELNEVSRIMRMRQIE
jgi:uncharacterized membrane protein